jgi:enoyl-CoA hydratase
MSQVLFRVENHIAYVTLNDPGNLNAVNYEMVLELEKIWAEVRDNKDIWIAILNGEGRSFCAGANVKSMERGNWRIKENSLLLGNHRGGPLSHNVYKPIIVAVHKHVYGAGMCFLIESDICIAADDALFCLPEAKVNIPTLFAPVIGHFLPHSIASEMLYTAQPISAQRAYELGLCSKVVPRAELMNEATAMAKVICENGPLANWAAKELYYRGRNLNYDDFYDLLNKVAVPVMNSEDGIEAKAAFVEKRKPNWKLR